MRERFQKKKEKINNPSFGECLPKIECCTTVAAVENATFFIFNLNINMIEIVAYFDTNFSMILPNNLIFF